jgi:hypothetical protein
MRPISASRNRRGVALLVALGVLVILALLGSVFATMSGIERAVSRNHLDKVRARLLAQSGVEHAVAQLWQPDKIDIWRVDQPVAWTYNGGDRNGNGILDPGDVDENHDGFPDREALPVTRALAPSFFVDENPRDGLPDLIRVGDRTIGYSGCLGIGTYAPRGNVYSVRVRDLGGKINVNNVHPNLVTMLTSLFTAINLGDPAGTAQRIVVGRPPTGYTDPSHLRAVVGRTVHDRIKDYVTTVGWVDTREVDEPRRIPRPIPLDRGYRRRDLAIGKDVFARWELRPTLKYDAAVDGPAVHGPRTPVNINDAPIEVLVAILQGLKGFYVYEDKFTTFTYDWANLTALYDGTMPEGVAGVPRRAGPAPGAGKTFINGRIGTIYETTAIPAGTRPTAGSTTVPNGDGAWGIARAIIDERNKPFVSPPGFSYTGVGPQVKNIFRNFQQFNEFIDGLDPMLFKPIPGWDQPRWALPLPQALADRYRAIGVSGWGGREYQANEVPMVKDVLKANFNPNMHFNALNPNELLGCWIDKANLTWHSFEISFYPMGFFEIQSAGWVLDRNSDVVAEEIVTADVKLFETYRDTTQWDFMREWAVDGVSLDRVFSGSGGSLETPNGVSLCSYPEYQRREFLADPNTSLEGYLALNTVKSLRGRGSTFAARFDNDISDFSRFFFSQDPDAPCFADETVTPFSRFAEKGPWADRLLGGKFPGSAVNDGLLSEVGSSPGYLGFENDTINQHVGTVSMWVKPAFQPENTGRQRAFLTSYYYGKSDETRWPLNAMGVFYTAQHAEGPYYSSYMGDPHSLHQEDNTGALYDPGTDKKERTRNIERSIMAGHGGRYPKDEPNSGIVTPTLNHVGHNHATLNGWGNFAMNKRWMHVLWVWDDALDPSSRMWRLYVNGQAVNNSYAWAHPDQMNGATVNTRWDKTDPVIQQANVDENRADGNKLEGVLLRPPLVRVGAEAFPQVGGRTLPTDAYWASPDASFEHSRNGSLGLMNYTADATIDDVLVWTLCMDDLATVAWQQGRYCRENGATYTSPVIALRSQPTRVPPPKGSAPFIPGSIPVAGAIPSPVTRMAFVAVTAYWPVNLPSLNPPEVPFDAAEQDLSGTMLSVAITSPTSVSTELMPMQKIPLGGTAVTDNATYSTDPAAGAGRPVEVSDIQFRYRVRIDPNFKGGLNDGGLTVTPILDDVTVAYYNRLPSFQSFVVGEE